MRVVCRRRELVRVPPRDGLREPGLVLDAEDLARPVEFDVRRERQLDRHGGNRSA
jgi:hypothetical protein